MRRWENLPEAFRTTETRPYYDLLSERQGTLVLKRIFDLVMSFVLIMVLAPVILLLGILIALDSRGPVIFTQKRVGRYGEDFTMFKFRSMRQDAESLGPQISVGRDPRISRVGHVLRKTRLDELPQLLNILLGDMSFVGVRPEVPRYVAKYTPEMWATLLLRPGVTSPASIRYKDEAKILADAVDPELAYVEDVLPQKMMYNYVYLRELSFVRDLKILMETVIAVLR